MIQSAMLISIIIAIADSPFLLALETQSVAGTTICLQAKNSSKRFGQCQVVHRTTARALAARLGLVWNVTRKPNC
jgi:hypothetical protein